MAGSELLTTRLGEDMSSQRALRREAMERTVLGLLALFKTLSDYGVEDVYAFATSAVREAQNKEEFLEIVRKRVGLDVYVLSGEEEALQSLLGVEVGIGVKDNYLLFDIGGGSTEIAIKRDGKLKTKSFPIGALKLKERFKGSMEEMFFFLRGYWQEEAVLFRNELYGISSLIGVGGILTSLVLLKDGFRSYDIRLVHGKRISLSWLYHTLNCVKRVALEDLRERLAFDPGRAEIFIEGGTILLSLLDFFSIPEIMVSETDLLWGGLVKKWDVKKFVF